jgi:hypothetical protein
MRRILNVCRPFRFILFMVTEIKLSILHGLTRKGGNPFLETRTRNLPNSRYCYVFECVGLQMEYGFTIGFSNHLYTPLGSTSNYSAIVNLHTSQITTTHAKSLAACVLNNRSPSTASKSRDFSASHAQVLSSQPSVQKTDLPTIK